MKLHIDTSDLDKVKLTLTGDKIYSHNFQTRNLSEELLSQIKSFLLKSKLNFKQLSEIQIKTNQAHFSRNRTSVATVNSLIFALNLPQKLVTPVYDKQPNITLPGSSKKS